MRRVALLDNTVNISYVTAKILRADGVDAELIQAPGAPFNQQPVWEDMDLVEPTEDGRPPARSGYWEAREAELGWRKPDWIVRPRPALRVATAWPAMAARLRGTMPAALLPFGLALSAREAPAIAAARERDVVLTLGPAAGQAYLSGRPYAVVLTGWDVRELPFLTGARSPFLRARAWLQRTALIHAEALLVQPAWDLPHLRRLGLAERALPYCIPVDVERYAAVEPRPAGEVFGAEIAERIRGKVLFFAPARLHFALKRNDALINAFATVARRHPAHLLLLAWGPDLGAAKALVRDLGIGSSVSFLPLVMSKVRVMRAIQLADVVADQFLAAAYGMLALEALACGRPVISSYDPAQPQPHAADDPAPILTGRTAAEIADACLALLDPGRRAAAGADGRAWSRRQGASSLRSLRDVLGLTS